MHNFFRKHTVSFKAAFEGLAWAFSTQPNFKIHTFLAVLALSAGIFFHVTRMEMIVLLFTVIFGFTAEMANTAIESVTDLVTTEWKKDAKIAKDVAAGMMLLVAFGATLIALLILVPYLHFSL